MYSLCFSRQHGGINPGTAETKHGQECYTRPGNRRLSVDFIKDTDVFMLTASCRVRFIHKHHFTAAVRFHILVSSLWSLDAGFLCAFLVFFPPRIIQVSFQNHQLKANVVIWLNIPASSETHREKKRAGFLPYPAMA